MHWSYIVWGALAFLGFFVLLQIVLRFTGGYAPGWQIRCWTCGDTRDGAEVGMVRVSKSKGKFTGTFGWCRKCRRLRFFIVERTPETVLDRASDSVV